MNFIKLLFPLAILFASTVMSMFAASTAPQFPLVIACVLVPGAVPLVSSNSNVATISFHLLLFLVYIQGLYIYAFLL